MQEAQTQQPVQNTAPATNNAFDEKQFALFIHLSTFVGLIVPFGNILAPLVLWTMKRKESEYIDYHGKEAVNFNISIYIWLFISIIAIILIVGLFMILGLFLASVILPIIAGIAAHNGERYRYPFTFRFIK
ncbi:MAG: DUF4870 domain-containing protein [Patescibacteria group bacterium]